MGNSFNEAMRFRHPMYMGPLSQDHIEQHFSCWYAYTVKLPNLKLFRSMDPQAWTNPFLRLDFNYYQDKTFYYFIHAVDGGYMVDVFSRPIRLWSNITVCPQSKEGYRARRQRNT